jgi:hypothetical protein
MPAEFADQRIFGVGVTFPMRPLIDNATRRKMHELGFRKMPLQQTYLGARTLKNTLKVCDFIRDYNKVYYPEADPVRLPPEYYHHVSKV